MYNTDENEIKNKLLFIFNRNSNISSETFENNPDLVLFNEKINLKPYQLVYIFFDTEKVFGIQYDSNDIASGRFITFNSLYSLICDKVLR